MSRDRVEKLFRVLQYFCPPQLYEGIEGDLREEYELDVTRLGARRARWKLIGNMVRFFHPGIIFRNKLNKINIYSPMWRNYLKVGWRNILKNRFYSAINVFGLALGIGFAYLTFLYVSGELRYDHFHKKADRIYRIVEKTVDVGTGEVTTSSVVTPIPLSTSLIEDYPEIESISRFGSFSSVVEREDESFSQSVIVADREFFQLFDFDVITGSNNLFKSRNEVVLSTKGASIYFGEGDAVGKTLDIKLKDSVVVFTVSAVIDNHSDESSLTFDVVIPFENFEHVVGEEVYNSLNYGVIETYMLLKEGNSVFQLEAKLNKKEYEESSERGNGTAKLHSIQPLKDIHLNNTYSSGITSTGNPIYVYVLSGAGLLILFMACVNFVSLTSGHSLSRVKEVGVRKTMGAFRSQIRNQLMAETFIICFIATTVGLILVYFFVPYFNQLINATLEFGIGLQSFLFICLLLVVIVLVAGGIPARLLTMLQPVQALKNGIDHGGRKLATKTLVIVQFTLSLTLLIGTFIMNDQMDFIYEKNLGFDKERLFEVSLNSPSSGEVAERLVEVFKSAATSESRIMSTTASMNDYQEPWTKLEFEQIDADPIGLYFNLIETDYLKTMKLELVSGRWFNGNEGSGNQIVVNESLLKYFNWEDHIGKQIPGKNFSESHEIIGVVKNFHFSSLHNQVEPLILALDKNAIVSGVTGLTTYRWPPMFSSMTIRIAPGEIQPSLKGIEAVWDKVNPDAPFTGHFVDDSLDAQYANEKRWKKAISYSSAFALVISILGLIGLVRLLLQRKIKEIGIRKTLGSGFGHLVLHFSKGFVAVLVLANLLAWPFAWWAGQKWLQVFTYRIELTVIPFFIASMIVCCGVFAVIIYLTWRASLIKPVTILKNE
ncbi:MAG TPA: ABC transporter permease [Cyclobacteriaceae bacterium]|nr:ABC transporter permease [Cyclobacteriaceae bacterium]